MRQRLPLCIGQRRGGQQGQKREGDLQLRAVRRYGAVDAVIP
jgi:hypothetical protein